MRAFINAIPGVYRNAQYSLSEEGFNELGIETVMFFSKEEVVDMQRGDILISTKRLVGKRLEELGAMPELDTHPAELLPFMSPSERLRKASEITEADLPAFIRPDKIDRFAAVAARGMIDFKLNGIKGDVWTSDIEHFMSTWRCFVRYGKVISINVCEGDPKVLPDFALIHEAGAAWTSAPAGAALDFGVTEDGRTQMFTTRDGWCLDPCGMDAHGYALLLAARWAQMVGVEDELAGIR
jgi:hypothetical protein